MIKNNKIIYINFNENMSLACKKCDVYEYDVVDDYLLHNIWKQGCPSTSCFFSLNMHLENNKWRDLFTLNLPKKINKSNVLYLQN